LRLRRFVEAEVHQRARRRGHARAVVRRSCAAGRSADGRTTADPVDDGFAAGGPSWLQVLTEQKVIRVTGQVWQVTGV
jgi:hypothetical protein